MFPEMFPRSIKWRLQLWYGLILVVVLAGFGFTAYQLERGRLFGRIDDELHRRVEVLAGALRRPPPRGPEGNGPPFGGPPPGQFPDDGPPGQHPRPPREFHLPPEAAHFFDSSDPNNFYFLIQRDGEELARSTNVPPNPSIIIDAKRGFELVNNLAPQFPGGPAEPPRPAKVVDLGNYRVTVDALPSGEIIWVGCSIVPELKELRHTAFKLSGVGGIILFFGLAGGWWIVSRSLRPIVAISSAAMKISAGDLSQRINVAEAESELGQLAAVLNSTFARLETAFALQKQFAVDAAHELRTPVSVMLAQTQTALNRERDAEAYKRTIEACQRAAQRMRKLIESLLALARYDAGQEVLQRARFDFSEMVADCVELVQPLAQEQNIRVSTDIEPFPFTGDPGRLAQVVTNLLTNAIQYNRPGGEVCVSLKSQAALAVLTVADNGRGIAVADAPMLFRRFFRADPSRTGAGNSGLGLAISRAIVEAHGGNIEVSSKENVGTTVTVRLPAL
jgi:two-component system, OmpR family, sensor kinase